MKVRKMGRYKKTIGLAGLSLTTLVGVTACGASTSTSASTGSSSSSNASNSSNSSNNTSSGGSGTSASGKKVTINVYVGKFTIDPQAQSDLYNNTLIPEFEKENPNITVKWSDWATSSEENTSLQTALATHQGPDLFELGSTLIPTAYATNGFKVLSSDDWNTLGGRSKFFPAQLTMSGPSADKDIAVPEYMQPFAMVYNKKMFADAGITSPPTTWTEFVDDAKKMTNPAKNQWGTVMSPADSFDPWKIGWNFTKQYGSDYVSSDLKTATLDSKASVEGLSFWFDWLTKFHIASPNDVTYKGSDAQQQFENGHVGMMIMVSSTLVPSLDKSAVKGDYAYAPMPTVPYGMTSMPQGGTPVQTIVSGQYLAIPNYVSGDKYQAVLKWLKFVTDVTQQKEFFKVYGYMPANLDAYKNYAPLDTPLINAFVAAEKNASPTPFTGAWGNLEVIYAGVSSKIADEIATKSYHPGDIAKILKAANTQLQSSLQQ